MLIIELPNVFIDHNIDIEIFNMIGQSIFKLNIRINDSKVEITKMQDLPSGIYLMKFSIGELNKSAIRRIIKE